MLRTAGELPRHRVVTHPSFAALRAIQAGDRYDLMVADVNMPGMSGPQLVARMRRTGVYPKVLYLTGFAERLLGAHTSLWLDDAFVEKPCTAQDLVNAVTVLLSRAAAAR